MSLFDESFPTDIDINITNFYEDHNKISNNLLPNHDVKFYGDSQIQETVNSDNSDEKLNNIVDEACSTSGNNPQQYKVILKKKNFINQKSHSYNDLHSVYTKTKYQHVKSKVQQYIADMKAQDKRRHSTKSNSIHHGSLPETMNNSDFGSMTLLANNSSEPTNIFQKPAENTTENNMVKNNSNNEQENIRISEVLNKKEQQIANLKHENEYLQSNLDSKTALAAKYKRNFELLRVRVELIQFKEREKQLKEANHCRYRHRNSLLTSYSYLACTSGKVTASTQTDKIPETNINHDYLNFSDTFDFCTANGSYKNKIDGMIIFNESDMNNNTVEVNNVPSFNNVIGNQLRRRSNSNSMKLSKNNNLYIQDENGTSSSSSSSSLDARTDTTKTNGSDSAIETDELLPIEDSNEEDDEESSINIRRTFLKKFKRSRKSDKARSIRLESNGEALQKKQKKRVTKKLFLRTLFGSCIKCCRQDSSGSGTNDDQPITDIISYKEIRLSQN